MQPLCLLHSLHFVLGQYRRTEVCLQIAIHLPAQKRMQICGQFSAILVMVVTSREDENGFVTINGGLEQGGVDLTSDDSGVYYAVGLDDTKSYHELGKVTVPVAEGFVLTDNADPEHPDETYAAADLAELAASEPGFTANNTLATIEHGKLTVLARSYTP